MQGVCVCSFVRWSYTMAKPSLKFRTFRIIACDFSHPLLPRTPLPWCSGCVSTARKGLSACLCANCANNSRNMESSVHRCTRYIYIYRVRCDARDGNAQKGPTPHPVKAYHFRLASMLGVPLSQRLSILFNFRKAAPLDDDAYMRLRNSTHKSHTALNHINDTTGMEKIHVFYICF